MMFAETALVVLLLYLLGLAAVLGTIGCGVLVRELLKDHGLL